jgi:hypothetical protein
MKNEGSFSDRIPGAVRRQKQRVPSPELMERMNKSGTRVETDAYKSTKDADPNEYAKVGEPTDETDKSDAEK